MKPILNKPKNFDARLPYDFSFTDDSNSQITGSRLIIKSADSMGEIVYDETILSNQKKHAYTAGLTNSRIPYIAQVQPIYSNSFGDISSPILFYAYSHNNTDLSFVTNIKGSSWVELKAKYNQSENVKLKYCEISIGDLSSGIIDLPNENSEYIRLFEGLEEGTYTAMVRGENTDGRIISKTLENIIIE